MLNLNLLNCIFKLVIFTSIFLVISIIFAFFKKELNNVLKDIYEKCFEWAAKFYNKFSSKLYDFHERLTSSYKENIESNEKKRFITESSKTNLRIVAEFNDIIKKLDSLLKKLPTEVYNAVSLFNMQNMESIQRNNNQLKESLNKVTSIENPGNCVETSVKGKLWFAYLLTTVVLFFNTFLLAQFFRDIFMLNLPIIKYPIRIELAHPLSMIFGMLEIACGWIYSHEVFKEKKEDYSTSVGARKAWILLGFIFLITVEVFSFATLSSRVNIADILGIPQSNVLYTISHFFMIFFAIGLGIIEFMLGIYISELSEIRNNEKASINSMNYVIRIKKQSNTVINSIEKLDNKLSNFLSIVKRFPDELRELLKPLLDQDGKNPPCISILRSEVIDTDQNVYNEFLPTSNNSKQNIYIKILYDLSIAIVWGMLVFSACSLFINNFSISLQMIFGNNHENIALPISLLLTATLVLCGFRQQKVHINNEVEINGDVKYIKLYTIIIYILLTISFIIVSYLSYLNNKNFLFSLLIGLLTPLAIFFFSSLFYQTIPSLSFSIQIIFLTVIWAIQYLTRTIFLFIAGATALTLYSTINIISSPGVIIINTFKKKDNV